VKSRAGHLVVLVAGVCPAHLGDSVVRDGPFMTAVVRWTMLQVCPRSLWRWPTVSDVRCSRTDARPLEREVFGGIFDYRLG
jgi:hypothetical protein